MVRITEKQRDAEGRYLVSENLDYESIMLESIEDSDYEIEW